MSYTENLNVKPQRDSYIDDIRGFAMFWVLIVHSIYWVNTFNNHEILRSFLLFEMPIFFFVIGATTQLTNYKSYFNFVLKRVQAILIPYWIYATICTVLIVLVSNYNFTEVFLSWINPYAKHLNTLRYLPAAIWFVPVYINCILLTPLIFRLKNIHWGIKLSIILIVYVISIVFYCKHIDYASFYLLWIFAGTFYFELKSITPKKRTIALLFLLIGFVLMFILHNFFDFSFNMQDNKFPPNFMFLAYSISIMSFLYLISEPFLKILQIFKKNKIFNILFSRFSKYSLTIFLFHPFCFLFTYLFIIIFNINLSQLNLFVVFVVVTTIGSIILSYLFGWIQKIRIIKV